VPDEPSARIAVLIDADNTSPRHASDILKEIATYGTATTKRAYGDWTTQQLAGWKSELLRHAIHPEQQFAYTTGKNSTDSSLIIDAMDLLYTGNFDAFAIVSSDSDFTRLAGRLREAGATVYGLGQRKTPEPFRAACDRFIFLEVLAGERQEEELDLADLRRLLLTAVESTSQDDGWATMSAIGNYLSNRDTSFDSRNYGYPKLSTLARAQSYLEVGQGAGSSLRVRVKPTTKKSAAKKGAKKAAKKQASAQ
jgi:uncharacterized LabA/DUF88 family protein